MQYSVVDVLGFLRPWDPIGLKKVRIGRDGDGGYVLLDLIRPGQLAFSYGVGPDVSFDSTLAAHGLRVFMFDHTVPQPQNLHPNCFFHAEGVGPRTDPIMPCDTITAHVARYGSNRRDLILKMDVEGSEWHSLLETPDQILCQFEQIVMELHSLESLVHLGGRMLRANVFEKVNKNFRLFHVHSNNAQNLFTVDGLPVPNLLEVSYARADLCDFTPATTVFPTELDSPCVPDRPDHRLWFFPFLPGFAAPRAV